MCSDYFIFKRGLQGTFLNKLYFIYIYIFIYKSFVCCMTLIISIVGRCNLSICANQQVNCTGSSDCKGTRDFHIDQSGPFYAFRIVDRAQCHTRLFLSFERWMHLFCVYIYISVYICKCYKLYAGFELWYPVDTPLPHF